MKQARVDIDTWFLLFQYMFVYSYYIFATN